MAQPDPHHPAASGGLFAALKDFRVVRMPFDGAQIRMLQLNHPHHGWMSLLLEEKEARELIRLLTHSLNVAGNASPERARIEAQKMLR